MGRSLFTRLPDEIVWQCLVRVELKSHHNIALVCKSWNAALKNPQFYSERRRLKISEQRVCLLGFKNTHGILQRTVAVYDPNKDLCQNLPPFPGQNSPNYHCHFVKRRLFLIADMAPKNNGNSVWLFDFSRSKWQQGTKLPKWQRGFASAADEHGGLIYVCGGFSGFSTRVRSAFVYNVELDRWDSLPDMNASMKWSIRGGFVDGKIYVTDWSSILIFDSSSGSWETTVKGLERIECEVNELRHYTPFVTAHGRLCFFSSKEMIEYDHIHNKLNIVATLPPPISRHIFVNFAVGLGNKFFMHKCHVIPAKTEYFYMISPPNEKRGAVECIPLRTPSGLDGRVTHATVLEL